MAERWRSFGWDVIEDDAVEGDAAGRIAARLNSIDTSAGPPRVLIARTRFGKGVSFMESQIKWHYWPMSEDEYARALREVNAE